MNCIVLDRGQAISVEAGDDSYLKRALDFLRQDEHRREQQNQHEEDEIQEVIQNLIKFILSINISYCNYLLTFDVCFL